MRVLVVGGTRFVGHAIAARLLQDGHEVSVLHRGLSSASGVDGAINLIADREGDLSVLAAGEWDATIDVSAYRPNHVTSLAKALGDRGGHHVLISTVSVYANDIPPMSNESARLTDTDALLELDLATCDIDGSTYGPLKVLCERAVETHYDSPLILRPTYVIGPNDYTMRFPSWIERFAAGGVVLAPEPRTAAIQYIDARDLADFVVRLTVQQRAGVLHVAAPAVTFEQMLNTVKHAVGPHDTVIEWMVPESEESGAEQFPLWSGRQSEPVLELDSGAAIAAGLTHRPLAESAIDTLEWLQSK